MDKREEDMWFSGTSTQKGHIVPDRTDTLSMDADSYIVHYCTMIYDDDRYKTYNDLMAYVYDSIGSSSTLRIKLIRKPNVSDSRVVSAINICIHSNDSIDTLLKDADSYMVHYYKMILYTVISFI
jgi:hypothetical protein